MPDCAICNDTGWKPIHNGTRVTRCECRHRLKEDALLSEAQIPLRYADCRLNRFFPPGDDDGSIENARSLAASFVEKYPAVERGLMFIGNVGLGKTHLAVSILRELIAKGIHCRFRDYRELLKEIQNSYNPEVHVTELQLLQPLFDVEVLVIDELGAVRASEWVWDTVALLINYRYNHKKTTIVTTNFPNAPSQMASDQPISSEKKTTRPDTLGDRVGDRMLSRLNEMCAVVDLTGQDHRRRKDKLAPLANLRSKPGQQ